MSAHHLHYQLLEVVRKTAATNKNRVPSMSDAELIQHRRLGISSTKSVRKAAKRAKDKELEQQCDEIEKLVNQTYPLPV